MFILSPYIFSVSVFVFLSLFSVRDWFLTLSLQGAIQSSWASAKTNNPTAWKERSISGEERKRGGGVVQRELKGWKERWNDERVEVNGSRESVQVCVKDSTVTLQVVRYGLKRFRCDYSESPAFLCNTGLTVWAFFPSLYPPLNLFFSPSPSSDYSDLCFPEMFRSARKNV